MTAVLNLVRPMMRLSLERLLTTERLDCDDSIEKERATGTHSLGRGHLRSKSGHHAGDVHAQVPPYNQEFNDSLDATATAEGVGEASPASGFRSPLGGFC
jgi:hypothetical protein